MHQQEQARLHVLNSVIAEEITIAQAAALMNLSERHARRLLAAYRKDGAEALAHGNRGRRPHNAVPEVVAAAVVHLAATHYPGANHTHLSELLEEQEGILLSRPTLRRILTRAGLPSPRRRRPPAHRVRRERMPREGMLLQVDGSHHAWLEDRGPRFALLLAVGRCDRRCPAHAVPTGRGRPRLLPAHGGGAAPLGCPARAVQRPPRRLPGHRPAARRPRRFHPVCAGDGGAGGPPHLRPLTAGQGARRTHSPGPSRTAS